MADTLLQEVDEALRADRAGALWAKYRGVLIAACAGVLLLTAANSAWQYYIAQKHGAMMLMLNDGQKLLGQGKATEAAAVFDKAAQRGRGAFKDLALVWQSRALVKAGKTEDAVKALETAVADGNNLWSDVACLRLAGLTEAKAEACLNKKSSSPLAATRQQWAAAHAWAKGDVKTARAQLQALIDAKETSPSESAKLTQWLQVMPDAPTK